MQPISPSILRHTALRAALSNLSFREALLTLSLVGVLAFGLSNLAEATPLTPLADDGQSIFQQKCSACHTIGGGKMAGPDLKGITARRDRAWLARFISTPDQVLAQKDPTATQLLQEFNNVPMPNLGLSQADVNAILAFFETQGGGASPQAPASAQPKPALAFSGDAATGKALFNGIRPLQNGGAPCISCHTIAGMDSPGGGALGPDLTATFNKYGGETGMASVLGGLPFPTMSPIFQTRPLTPEEQASIGAFLKASAAQQPADHTWTLVLLALIGLAVLLVIAQATWSRKLLSVRRAMIDETRARGGFTR